MQSISLLHRAARSYAEAGIPVFPCVPGGKQPATANGFKDATTDIAQIDAWWAENPNYNLAICPDDAGWCVVDIDGDLGEANWSAFLAENNEPIPRTYTVRTPRGGRHLYFAGQLPPTSSRLAKKVDTRGTGSYVLVPPSIVEGKPYELVGEFNIAAVPEILPRLIGARDRATALSAEVGLDEPANVVRASSLLSHYVSTGDVAVEGQGGDDRTYRLCAEVLNLGLSTGAALALIADEWNPHCQPPWDLEELRVKVSNAAQYAQNEAGAWAVSPASEVFGDALDKLPASVREKRSRFHPENEQEQEEGKDPSWLIPKLMQEASTVLLFGATQSYKSFMALDAALGLASGASTFGAAPATSGPVFYAALEGKHNIKKQRRRAWKIARGVDALPNFYVMNAPMIALDGEMQEFGDEIARRCAGARPKMIVLDTVAKCMAGLNENDAGDAGRFIRFCDSLVEAFGCTVVAIHHTGKDEGRGARGSAAFHAGFDSVVEVKASRATKAVEVWVRKHKDAEEPETPWTFQGRVIGPSLVFFPTTADEHRDLSSKDDPLAPKRIGQALQDLNARGEQHGVTTHVLASALYQGPENEPADTRSAKIGALARKLGALSRTKLQAYCSASAGGIIWWLPPASQ